MTNDNIAGSPCYKFWLAEKKLAFLSLITEPSITADPGLQFGWSFKVKNNDNTARSPFNF